MAENGKTLYRQVIHVPGGKLIHSLKFQPDPKVEQPEGSPPIDQPDNTKGLQQITQGFSGLMLILPNIALPPVVKYLKEITASSNPDLTKIPGGILSLAVAFSSWVKEQFEPASPSENQGSLIKLIK